MWTVAPIKLSQVSFKTRMLCHQICFCVENTRHEYTHCSCWIFVDQISNVSHWKVEFRVNGKCFLLFNRLVSAIGDTYGVALLLHMLTSTICLTLLAYQATKVDGINVYALSTIGYLVYALGQVFHFCIFGNRLIEEVMQQHIHMAIQPENREFHLIPFIFIFVILRLNTEFIGYGSGLLLSLVWWFRGSKNIRSDRVSTMSEGYDHFWCKVFHCFVGFVRIGIKIR